MDSLPGTYALILAASQACNLTVGKLGTLAVQPGYYIYVGSAFGPGGVRARVAHHRRVSPRPHWHIDYVRSVTSLHEIWYTYDTMRREHLWAHVLTHWRQLSTPLPGFGASDCACNTHLYYAAESPSIMHFRQALQRVAPEHAAIYREHPSASM